MKLTFVTIINPYPKTLHYKSNVGLECDGIDDRDGLAAKILAGRCGGGLKGQGEVIELVAECETEGGSVRAHLGRSPTLLLLRSVGLPFTRFRGFSLTHIHRCWILKLIQLLLCSVYMTFLSFLSLPSLWCISIIIDHLNY